MVNGAGGEHHNVIAIDGPSAAGKSTVASLVAERLGALLFDTGLLYRALTLAAIRNDMDPGCASALVQLAVTMPLEIKVPATADGPRSTVYLGGQDVTREIRSPAVDRLVSQVAAHPTVRDALLPHQRRIAAEGRVVMVGRDIGTSVVPQAGLKIFLVASEEERARRRHREQEAAGVNMTRDQILADLRRRDALDSGRASSPLRAASDAVIVQTDGLDVDAVVDTVLKEARAVNIGGNVPASSSAE